MVASSVVILLPAVTLAVGMGSFRELKEWLFSGLYRLSFKGSFPLPVWWLRLLSVMSQFLKKFQVFGVGGHHCWFYLRVARWKFPFIPFILVEGVQRFLAVGGLFLVIHHAPLAEFTTQSRPVLVELGVLAKVTLGPAPWPHCQ